MNEFDHKASHWDAKLVRVSERKPWRRHSDRAALTLNMTALEYGCGTGLVSFALQPYLGHITLADSSSGMLAVLREKIAASQVQNMTPRSLDLTIDPLPTERYQLIYTLMTLHHIPDTVRMLRAFYALLDTPGYLWVADLDTEDGTFHEDEFHGHLGFDRAALSAQAREAGFQSIAFSTVFQDAQGSRRCAEGLSAVSHDRPQVMTPTLKTVLNFRDCGGPATVEMAALGRHLRGRVYRSGTLDDAQTADLRTLHTLGLKTIIDLRAPREKKRRPGAHRRCAPHRCAHQLETRTREKIQPLMTKRGAEQNVVDILKQMYRDLADEVWPQAGQLFKVLLTAEAYPVLNPLPRQQRSHRLHVRAGGAGRGRGAGGDHSRLSGNQPPLRIIGPAHGAYAENLLIRSLADRVRASLSAREAYLWAAFDQIEHCHGGLTAYLAKCGVTACEIETLRGLLVE